MKASNISGIKVHQVLTFLVRPLYNPFINMLLNPSDGHQLCQPWLGLNSLSTVHYTYIATVALL